MITTVLFDLDGTLLPMDNDEFTRYYFKLLCKKLAPRGYAPEELINAVWTGTAAMVENDGSVSNEEAFWKCFRGILGDRVMEDREMIEEFYRNEFNQAKVVCGYSEELVELVRTLKERGLRLGLATNPIFPAQATRSRIGWAGLKPEDFEVVTTYENIGLSKPNPEYYREVMRRMNAKPEETLMVGNDATEDLAAKQAGAQVFLLTDCLLNKHQVDFSDCPHGDVHALRQLLGLEN